MDRAAALVHEKPAMHCTLLIPNLLWPPDAGDEPYRNLDVPALTRLLARGRCTAFAPAGMEAWLCSAFDVERQQDWPVAPLTLNVDGGDPGAAYWLRCDPVHLRAQRGQLHLAELSAFAPTPDEAGALAETLNAHFSAEGLVFRALRPARWYLSLERAPALATHPLADVAGKDIDRYLPGGDERLRWHRLLNEIQMLWHDHPVNLARETRGAPEINSVWLWGGGVQPAVRGRHFTGVWSDDALAAALAAASAIASQSLPGSAAPLVSAPATSGDKHLAVLPHLRAPAGSGDFDQWHAALQALERDWFAPLYAGLRERRLAGLALVMLNAKQCLRYDITGVDAWKFWRPLRALARYA